MDDAFLRKLRHGAGLTDEDERVLQDLAKPVRTVNAHADIAIEGSEPHHLPLILEGWAYRYKLLDNGKRQIISVFVPGDLCQPFGVVPQFLDYSLAALTPVTFAAIKLNAIGAAATSSPHIRKALWWDLLVTSTVERERIVSLGRRTASERLAHLLCELWARLNLVGLTDNAAYDLPLTQIELGDLLGLSSVHVNRLLQELRKAGLISLRGRRLVIHDLKEMRELSFFDDSYLQLQDHSRIAGSGFRRQ